MVIRTAPLEIEIAPQWGVPTLGTTPLRLANEIDKSRYPPIAVEFQPTLIMVDNWWKAACLSHVTVRRGGSIVACLNHVTVRRGGSISACVFRGCSNNISHTH